MSKVTAFCGQAITEKFVQVESVEHVKSKVALCIPDWESAMLMKDALCREQVF
jgi:hypothetical protein